MKDTANIILRTINFMEEHLKDDLKLNDIAKFTGYSKYHLNRIFTETVGCTMHKYIQKRRLTEAAKQLVYTNIPIIEIALEAKYDSQQAFTLAFRQVYLQTP
ncbi:helix-turn-helix domain-containing protein [Anaerocolumna sedimenticola]|uniref:Helix-turn-helix domain-containing protein n=1 Tax=Anaerocolumna sedimenticola TaxID=2696063 RepID=A0A6P1TVL3_9FIRM|nr:AraC family transcriptional regulator [Anaerocolumna sedimenticola]QHQ63528.1 helix-turn-helix domain-containing protein [Anaerocolumna sedimenticola]